MGRVQACSGLLFAIFLVLHLLTTVSGVAGAPVYDRILAVMRSLYRPHVVVELGLIVISGTVHIGCAVLQMARRRRVLAVRGPWWMKAHRLSGYFLLVTVVAHAIATRVLPAVDPTSSGADFAYVAYSVLGWPWLFWPYYLLLAVCGAVHLMIGAHLALRVLVPQRVRRTEPSRRYLLGAGAFVLAVVVGIGGILVRAPASPRQRFSEYRAIYQRFLPFLLRHRADER